MRYVVCLEASLVDRMRAHRRWGAASAALICPFTGKMKRGSGRLIAGQDARLVLSSFAARLLALATLAAAEYGRATVPAFRPAQMKYGCISVQTRLRSTSVAVKHGHDHAFEKSCIQNELTPSLTEHTCVQLSQAVHARRVGDPVRQMPQHGWSRHAAQDVSRPDVAQELWRSDAGQRVQGARHRLRRPGAPALASRRGPRRRALHGSHAAAPCISRRRAYAAVASRQLPGRRVQQPAAFNRPAGDAGNRRAPLTHRLAGRGQARGRALPHRPACGPRRASDPLRRGCQRAGRLCGCPTEL